MCFFFIFIEAKKAIQRLIQQLNDAREELNQAKQEAIKFREESQSHIELSKEFQQSLYNAEQRVLFVEKENTQLRECIDNLRDQLEKEKQARQSLEFQIEKSTPTQSTQSTDMLLKERDKSAASYDYNWQNIDDASRLISASDVDFDFTKESSAPKDSLDIPIELNAYELGLSLSTPASSAQRTIKTLSAHNISKPHFESTPKNTEKIPGNHSKGQKKGGENR